jgi:hypothetical protein
MINLFCGYDYREAVGFHVFVASVLASASEPVAITRLHASGMAAGSNAFTHSRFLVPHMMGYKGYAIFADACDMLCREDIAQLNAECDTRYAVQVVKHSYKTQHPLKYRGTDMQCPNRDYERKNWASLMIINCAHPQWRFIDPVSVAGMRSLDLLQLSWLHDVEIGELPDKWNRIVDEGQSVEGAALLHWTAGIPAFSVYEHAPGAAIWRAYRDAMLNATD